jgi:hypothetical protein
MAQLILEDAGSAEFAMRADCIAWRDQRFGFAELATVHSRFFLGFGSCSFREPVDELHREAFA